MNEKEIKIKIKGIKGDSPTKEELVSLITPLIPEPLKGVDGKDYILNDADKQEIADSITVPVVEKIIEKTEVIREQPIVTNEIKEVAVTDAPKKIKEKLLKVGISYKELNDTPDSFFEDTKKSIDETNYRLNRISSKTYALSELEDITITSPTNSQVLSYNTALKKWTNAAAAAGGGTWGSITGTLASQIDLQTALNAKQNSLAANTAERILFGDGTSQPATDPTLQYNTTRKVIYANGMERTSAATITRDVNNYVTSIALANGRTKTITRNASNYVTSWTDGIITKTFTRDANNYITSLAVT